MDLVRERKEGIDEKKGRVREVSEQNRRGWRRRRGRRGKNGWNFWTRPWLRTRF